MNSLSQVLLDAYKALFESQLDTIFPGVYYMRSEPIEGLERAIQSGFVPYNKRESNMDGHISHNPNRISIGLGSIHDNPALMSPFAGDGKVTYILSGQVESLQGFRPNSNHPNNSEFLVKRIPAEFIVGIICQPADKEYIQRLVPHLMVVSISE